jgi:GNAT superfamily N-acetyltransferase
MKIRRARPEVGPAYLDLVQALADFEKLPGPDPAARDRLLADAFAEAPPYELWVAEDGGRVVAYAVTFPTYSTFLARPSLWLEDLFVHPDARRRGIATAMLDHLHQVAVERGCGRFEWNVLDWNVDAQRFYEGMGAQIMGEWRLVRLIPRGNLR